MRPGSSYTLSGWVRGGYAFLGTEHGGTWSPPSGQWTRLSVAFSTGPATTSVRVYVHGWYAQAAFSADDLTLSGPDSSSTVPAPPADLAPSETCSDSRRHLLHSPLPLLPWRPLTSTSCDAAKGGQKHSTETAEDLFRNSPDQMRMRADLTAMCVITILPCKSMYLDYLKPGQGTSKLYAETFSTGQGSITALPRGFRHGPHGIFRARSATFRCRVIPQ